MSGSEEGESTPPFTASLPLCLYKQTREHMNIFSAENVKEGDEINVVCNVGT